MRLFKKVVDERQELEMMRVERVGFWVLLFGTAVSVIVQFALFNADFAQIAGEFFLLLLAVVVTLAGYVKKGQWDYYTNPGVKTYLIYSLLTAAAASLSKVFIQYKRLSIPQGEIAKRLLPSFAVTMVSMFVVCYGLLAFIGHLTKKRRARLDAEYKDDEQV